MRSSLEQHAEGTRENTGKARGGCGLDAMINFCQYLIMSSTILIKMIEFLKESVVVLPCWRARSLAWIVSQVQSRSRSDSI